MTTNPLSPHAFLFNADAEGIPSFYGGLFDPAFLNAPSKADPRGETRSCVLRGDVLIQMLCGRVSAVSKEQNTQGHTISFDVELYKTIIWDLVDAFSQQWNTFDLESIPFLLARKNIHCIVLPSFTVALRGLVDEQLQRSTGYLGCVEMDLGNPVQSSLFIHQLICDAYIADGAVHLMRNSDEESESLFEGANDFMPNGVKFIDELDYAEQNPSIPSAEISVRGQLSLDRYQGKRTYTIEERVLASLAQLREFGGAPYSFECSGDTASILEADMPEAKFVQYFLNPGHVDKRGKPDGAGKAKFFLEKLGIGPENWRYLASQFYQGLQNADFSELKIKSWNDGFGASFNCVMPITGLNGQSAQVFTNWIMHPGKIPQLSTARPTKDEERLAGAAQSHTYAVPSSLQGEEKWAAIYRLAHESGLSAAELCVPTPMKVVGFSVVMDGLCGFAWVQIPDARRGFARWVVRSGHGRPGYRGGARISAARLSQSIDRAVAYAKAFASVLQLNGIPCKVESRLD